MRTEQAENQSCIAASRALSVLLRLLTCGKSSKQVADWALVGNGGASAVKSSGAIKMKR